MDSEHSSHAEVTEVPGRVDGVDGGKAPKLEVSGHLEASPDSTDPESLRSRISRLREALGLDDAGTITMTEHSNHPQDWGTLGSAYIRLFQVTKSAADIDEALWCGHRALDLLHANESGNPIHADVLGLLVHGYWCRVAMTSTPLLSDLGAVTRYLQLFLNEFPTSSPKYEDILCSIDEAHMMCCSKVKTASVFRAAIEWFARYTPNDNGDLNRKITRLLRHASLFHELYKLTAEYDNLERSEKKALELLSILPPRHPFHVHCYGLLGVVYTKKFESVRHLEYISTSLEWTRKAIDEAAHQTENPEERLSRYGALALAYRYRFEASRELTDIQEAIKWSMRVHDGTGSGTVYYLPRLAQLVICLCLKLQATGSTEDDTVASTWAKKAHAEIPEHHASKPDVFVCLGLIHQRQYLRTGQVDAMEQAIQFYRSALDRAPPGHSARTSAIQQISSFKSSFSETQHVSFMDDRCGLMSLLELDGLESMESQCDELMSAAEFLLERANQWRTLADLEAATRLLDEAEKTLSEAEVKPRRLMEAIAASAMLRFTISRSLKARRSADEKSIALFAAYKDEPSVLYLRLNWLSHKYTFFRPSSEEDKDMMLLDLEESISISRKLYQVKRNVESHFAYLENNCLVYFLKYNLTEKIEDFELCANSLRLLLAECGDMTAQRSRALYNLGALYFFRYDRTSSEDDAKSAEEYLVEVTRCTLSPVRFLVQANWGLHTLRQSTSNWSAAYEAGMRAITQLPQEISHALNVSDRQLAVAKYAGNAVSLVYTILQLKKPLYEAALILEQGRYVALGSLRDIRTDISNLTHLHPDLKAKLIQNTQLLEAAIPQLSLAERDEKSLDHRSSESLDPMGIRYRASQALESITPLIREVPGLERFLRPPLESEIMAAATVAPIAIINVAHIGCDAILVDKRGWRPLKLPKLSFMDIFNHARFLVWRGLIDYKLLEWMWDTVAEPVLTALEIKGAPCDGCPWPRVQWILTGLLTGFPMHAAGYHSRTSSADTVIDRVISSYSSTLQAIIQNLKRSSDQTLTSKRTQVWKVAAVGAVAKDLQGVANEMRMLASQGKHLDVERVEPRAAEVSHALQQCDMFHFAGHGYLDATTPLQSGLILDGAERLTLADICGMKLHTRCPLLAYLSACGTGRTRDEALLDESMHLISGFQLAGFRHVIGTLWNVRDEVCVEVAKSVYGWMRNHSMSDDSVGEGLHHTLRSRRDASVLGGFSKADASPQFELIKAARESIAAESRSGHWKGMMWNGMGFDGLGMDFLQLGGSESTLDDGMGRDIIPRRQEQFKGFGLDWVPFIHSGS